MKKPEPQVLSKAAKDREAVIDLLGRILARHWLRTRSQNVQSNHASIESQLRQQQKTDQTG